MSYASHCHYNTHLVALGRARYDVVSGGIGFSLRQQGGGRSSDHNADLHERIDNVYAAAVIPHYEEFTTNEVNIITIQCY